MKSSLKTFLAGKNPFGPHEGEFATGLKGAQPYLEKGDNNLIVNNGCRWYIDILDDGTAINYCID
jgi:hypothetical protein